jgi:hypothetical protein
MQSDAAVRPQDRGDFESWLLLDRHLDLFARRGYAPGRWTAPHPMLCHTKA